MGPFESEQEAGRIGKGGDSHLLAFETAGIDGQVPIKQWADCRHLGDLLLFFITGVGGPEGPLTDGWPVRWLLKHPGKNIRMPDVRTISVPLLISLER